MERKNRQSRSTLLNVGTFTRLIMPTRRTTNLLFILAAPLIAVLIALVLLGRLGVFDAFVAIALAVAALAVIVKGYVADLALFRTYAEELARSGKASPPRLVHRGTLPELVAAVDRLHQSSERRAHELRDVADGNEAVLDGLLDPLIVINGNRRVLRANRAAREILGSQIAGRDLASVLRHPALLAVTDAVLAGAPGRQVEFPLYGPVERMFSARITPPARPTPDGVAAVIALYDLTAFKRIEQTRSDFIANASHELRTPLSVLIGCLQTLRGSAKDDPLAQARFLPMMQEQAERMSRLVSDLLALSRIELDEHTQPSGRVDVGRIVALVADALELKAKERGIVIAIDSAPDLPAVPGDEHELTLVLQNLIDNAIKYGQETSTVRVSARHAGAERPSALSAASAAVAVEVADQGEGIAPEHIPRLTERFYRVSTARSRELGGTGLGLAIVKHIVNRHRGVLTISSELGKGSRFTVWFPAAASRPKP